jgi:hypothetical protein
MSGITACVSWRTRVKLSSRPSSPLIVRADDRQLAAAAGGVDQNLDVAKRLARCGGDLHRRFRLHHVGDDDRRLGAARCFDFGGELLKQIAAPRNDGHLHAFERQRLRAGAADARTGAADERGLAFEVGFHFRRRFLNDLYSRRPRESGDPVFQSGFPLPRE